MSNDRWSVEMHGSKGASRCRHCFVKADSITSKDGKGLWLICGTCDAILVSRFTHLGYIQGSCIDSDGFPHLLITGYEDHDCQKLHRPCSPLFVIKSSDEMEVSEELLEAALQDSLVTA